MNSIRPNFGARRLRFSRIVYRCDVSSTDAAVIPLGVMCDLKIGNVYGLGLIARKHLAENEAGMVGALARSHVREPFKFLKREFDRVWSCHDKADEFERVAAIGFTAIEFGALAEKNIKVPSGLLQHPDDTRALKLWAKDQMEAQMRATFWALIGEHWVSEPEEREELLKAAA